MKTTNEELKARVAELENTFHIDAKHDLEYVSQNPYYRFASGQARLAAKSRMPKLASITCGLLAASVMLFSTLNQSNQQQQYGSFLPFASPLWYSAVPDPHTIEGAAEIHKTMQSGTVNVSKSTITGIIDSETMTASLYWTFILKNNNSTDKEASIIIDLPRNSALSRATLWINGVAQEAAFSSNTQVKNAYDSIVVRHRDPLLVTQIAPNRIKILAAPVTANGGIMQFRIGITAPAERADDGHNFVRLPSIVESNLKFDSQQDIHLNSLSPISGVGTSEQSGIYTLKANIPANEMNQVRIKMDTPSAKSFATRLTHTSPPEYIEANVSGGKLKLKRVKNPPNCELLTDDNVAFRLSNLWARQEIEKLAVSGDINEACNVANIYRIVSSVSGATVLEENFDYSNNGLNRDQYRTIGHEASTGSNFTHAVGFVPYSANVNSVNQGMRGVAIGAPGPEAPVLQGASFGTAAPMLQGATNGTIGPQGADATVIMGVNTAGTVRVNNLVLLENWLNVIASTVQIIGVALAAFMMSEAALNKGLKAPVQLSRVKTFWLALFVGTSAYFTPTGINALMAWMRDMNLFS